MKHVWLVGSCSGSPRTSTRKGGLVRVRVRARVRVRVGANPHLTLTPILTLTGGT